MKTADSQTHSQQHRADQSTSSAQGLESAFFSERSPNPAPFFPSAGFSGIQAKLGGDHDSFFQPTQVPRIQAKCGPCAAEKKQAEAPELQRMPAFESDDQAIQTKMMSGVRATTVQRMSAFESDEAHLQRQSLPHTEAITATSANLQAKCAACETEQQEKSEEQNEGELQVQRMPTASSPNEGNNEDSQPVQFSLKIGQPGDVYEREADAMADHVVDTPNPEFQHKLKQSTGKLTSSKLTLQPKSTSQKVDSGNAIRGDQITNQLKTSKGKGSSLDESIRSRMEPEFGADFSPVRIHTDSEAVQLNQDLGAQAFTHGSDIYFNNSKYNPHSKTGERLLAHELTHTVQQGAIPTSKSNHGIVQTNLIQRDTECEAEKEKRGSKEQAQQAETASNVGDCRQTNPPAEKPPEGTKEPEQQETPANIEAREGAPVDERQRNAPPPNENAPEGEKGIAETAKQTKPTASQEPCAVREAARAGVTGTGTTPAPRSISASGVKDQSANTPATGTEVNSFLVEAVQGTATNLQPERLGEAASPDVATERDELSVSADEALAMLNETSSTTAFVTASGLRFIAPIQQTDDPAAQQQALADHQSASSTADTFLSQAGQRLNNFIAQGIAATETLRAGTAEKEVVLMAQIQQRSARTQALMEQLRTSAQARAQAATQKIEARHLETIIAIDLRAMAAQAKLEPTYEEQAQQLEKAQKDQMTRLDEVYQTGYGNLLKIGREKGQQSMARAGEHKRAYRQAEGAPSDVQRRVRNRKKDGFWDGYLTYNRYMARADAAKKVGEEYRDGFQKEAQAQADNMMCGKSRDIETTQTIINQSLESLGCARNNAIDSIANQRQFATDMAVRARQEATNTLQNALRATLNQLNERETGQLQLIQDYGIRQEIAIERDSERAIGAVLKGVNDAASQVLQYLSQFRAQIEATEAPPPDIFAAQLAIEEAQLTASFDRAQTVLDQSLNQAQTSLDTGQLQALGALEQLYQRGANEAQQLVSSFHQTAQDLVAGTMNGYDQTLAVYDERITNEITNSTQVLQGVVAGAVSVFARINTGIESKFQQSASQMRKGMQKTLDDKLDQKVCSEAEKAAADVHPWWKTVLKVLLIIVVIVVVAVVLGPAIIGAVGAAATALAGSLGAGAALAGTIGAWVGPIIGGAIVGAIAGSAIQLGSNAIYNKPLTEGLLGAVIAGAIGGALGGVGGQLGQLLVGRIASTAFSRIAVQYGTDVAFDIVGGILGDLAAGNPITWESVVMGLIIGGAVQLSMGGVGSLAGRSRAARAAGTAEVPEGFVGRVARGRLGRAAERITDLQGGSMVAGERFGARVGGRGGKAPTAEATSAALANARTRMDAGEAFPIKGGQEPDGWRPPQQAETSDVTTRETGEVPKKPQESTTRVSEENGVRILIGGEEHNLSVRRIGDRRRLILCSNQCGEILLKVRRMQSLVEPDSPAWRDLELLAKQAIDADATVNSVTPRSDDAAVKAADEALQGLRSKMLEIHNQHPGLIDPNIPVVSTTGTVRASSPASTSRRINLADHLPSTAKTAGSQVTLDLSGKFDLSGLQGLGKNVEFVYAVRDNVTGEILKVGETANIKSRAGVYERAGRSHAMGRELSMDVLPITVKTSAHPTAASIENPIRSSVERGISQQRGTTSAPDNAPILPWDLTRGRLPDEPRGPGTPGVTDSQMRADGEYWWRERKWNPSAGPVPPSGPRPMPEWAVKLANGDSTNEALANAKLGELLRNHSQQEVADRISMSRGAILSYLRHRNLTVNDVKGLPPP